LIAGIRLLSKPYEDDDEYHQFEDAKNDAPYGQGAATLTYTLPLSPSDL
jgi:hypothetical protein